jgi:hypothetical protein
MEVGLMLHNFRHGRPCSFSLANSPSGSATTPSGGLSTVSAPSSSVSKDITSNFPAVFFLDSALFRRSLGRLPDVGFNMDPDVLEFLGNGFAEQRFVSDYFTLIHPWMPCLSKRHFMERVINPLGSARPENTLLIAAMKLVAMSPSSSNPRLGVYTAIEVELSRAAACGIFELRIFQAMLLLALYELGHAIYPAAYTTVGLCIRYGNALGFNMTLEDSFNGISSDIESEEKRRSWWAALYLDR